MTSHACFVAVAALAVCAGPAGVAAQAPGTAGAGAPSRLHASRASEPIRIDGRLDEAVWQSAPAATGFRQIEPVQDAPATLETEVRVLFDDEHLYVGAVVRDPEGAA
jgi:hypothetical protein